MPRKRYPEKYKDFVKYEAFKKNPFRGAITGMSRFKVRPKTEMLEPVYDPTGLPVRAFSEATKQDMQVGVRYQGEWMNIDRRQYTKMYVEFVTIIGKNGLSVPAVKMLFFILRKLKTGKDIIKFTISSAKAYTGYKESKSIYEGLVELMELGVIARKADTEEDYYINPQYIFKGKRDALLEEEDDEDSLEIE